MKFEETRLKGSFIVAPEPIEDERGFFTRWFCQKEFYDAGLNTDFVQCNQSGTLGSGSLRGMHFQCPPHSEVKLVKCTKGKIFDVIVDIRQGSETFLKWMGIELNDENKMALYIPKGFAHGFQVISDYAEIIYMVSAFYNKESEGGIRYNDETVGIKWPLAVKNISAKDLGIPLLSVTSFTGLNL